MANEVAKQKKFEITNKYDTNDMMDMVSGEFLSNVKLFVSESPEVKESKIPMNHYGIKNGEAVTDLGEKIDVLVLQWRYKALDMNDPIVQNYDKDSDTFKQIKEKSFIKDSKCVFGIEFLLWVPTQKIFAALYLNGKSSRKVAPTIAKDLGKWVTLGSVLCKNKEHTWFTNTCVPCSTPGEFPPEDKFQEELKKFQNPEDSSVEKSEKKDERER